jgi:hypothetical protein
MINCEGGHAQMFREFNLPTLRPPAQPPPPSPPPPTPRDPAIPYMAFQSDQAQCRFRHDVHNPQQQDHFYDVYDVAAASFGRTS